MEKLKSYQAPAYYLFHIWKEKRRILYMARNDFKSQYLKSFLGIFWAYFQPLILMAVIVIIFSLGLRGGGHAPGDVPFLVYFSCGFIAWNFFSGMLSSSSGAISSFSFLIKKVDFPLFVLPVVKILSSLFVHGVMVIVLGIIVYSKGFSPNKYWFQIIYYIFASSMLMLGISWFTASVSIFVDDLKKVIPVFIQLGFWGTPIFWSMEKFPLWAQKILILNPAFYIVNGYRDSLLYNKWFWEYPYLTLYFWGLTFLFIGIGAVTYRNTRPHFAEVI
jgi:lipopolysaccharide transport system permease protein/teichoic acid transport system permease protein